MPGMSIDFVPSGVGWAQLRLEAGGQVHRFPVSYLSDALGDLVRAVTLATRSVAPTLTRVVWESEPAVTTLVLDRLGDDAIGARLLRTATPETGEPIELLGTTASASELRRSVREACERVDRIAYDALWSIHPFPDAAVAELSSP